MTDKEFRHLLARIIQGAARTEELLEENAGLKTQLKQALDYMDWIKPGSLEDSENGRRIDLVFRIDETTIGYRTNPKAFIEEALETCKRELFQKLNIT